MIGFNAASQLLALGGIIVLQTVYSIGAARILGPEDFGRFAFIWSIVQIVLVGGDLGLHNTAVRRISADHSLSSTVFPTFASLKGLLSAVLFLLIALLALIIEENSTTRWTLLLFGIGMVFHSFNLTLNVVCQAHGKLYWASLNVFLIFFFQFLIGLSALLLGGTLISMAVAYVASTTMALFLNLRIFQSQIHGLGWRGGSNWKSFVRESLPVGLSTFFQTTSSRIAVSLLTLLVGSLHTGIFSAALRFTATLANIPVAVFGAILPVMVSLQQSPSKLRRLFRRCILLMLALSLPCAAGLYFLAEPLMVLIFGETYRVSAGNLQVLLWGLVPAFVGVAFNHLMLSQRVLLNRLALITGVALCTNVVANLLMIPRMASQGAALSTVLTEWLLVFLYVAATRKFLMKKSKEGSGANPSRR